MAIEQIQTTNGNVRAVQNSKVNMRYAFDLPHHMDKRERIVLGVLALFAKMQSLESLEPTTSSSRIFNQMFDLVTTSKTTTFETESILQDSRIVRLLPKLWATWGAAEYCLERDFARKVISGSSLSSCNDLYETFPYLDQYRQLARMESNTLDTAIGELELPPIRKIACIGSGPAPFTSLCLRERYGETVDFVNYDRNPEAITYGSGLVTSCGFSNITFEQADAHSLSGLQDFDVVHFAAMVGDSADEKTDLLMKVATGMRPGALMLLRSTDALRTLLYPRFEVDDSKVLEIVTPVVATRYFGSSTSLTAIVVKVDEKDNYTK